MRNRRTTEQVVRDLVAPQDVAIYLSARIKAVRATEHYLLSLCPPESEELLKQLIDS